MIFILNVGTSNLRLRLLDAHFHLADQIKAPCGVRQTALDGHAGALKTCVRDSLRRLMQKHGVQPAQVEGVIAYGMVTSALGLKEVPHLSAPVSAEDIRRHVVKEVFPDIAPFPFAFVPGVRCGADVDGMDMMRGEETETVGVMLARALPDACCLALPGSHNKYVLVENGVIQACLTTLSGELLDAVTHHTLLKDAVDGGFAQADELCPEQQKDALLLGANASFAWGMTKALFTARTLRAQGKREAAYVRHYLLGVMLAADAAALKRRLPGGMPVYVAGSALMEQAMPTVFSSYGIAAQALRGADMDAMGQAGALHLALSALR